MSYNALSCDIIPDISDANWLNKNIQYSTTKHQGFIWKRCPLQDRRTRWRRLQIRLWSGESHQDSLNGRVATDEGNPNGEGLPQWTSITKNNLDAAPVMIIDVEWKEVASPKRRTLTARSRNITEARRSNSVWRKRWNTTEKPRPWQRTDCQRRG